VLLETHENNRVTKLAWERFVEETLANLGALIRLDTTNPPGNERRAADFIAKALGAEGLDATIIEPAPI
jgi:acetylornithine deacetylase/succinyl-diaminopimelate desuccinylase-like protein